MLKLSDRLGRLLLQESFKILPSLQARPSRPSSVSTAALFRTMAQVQKAVVRSVPGEPNLTISLTVGGRQRNLDRPKDEPLEKPLIRIQKTVNGAKEARQKQPKRSVAAGEAVESFASNSSIALYEGPNTNHPAIDPSITTNEDAWKHGRLLVVGSDSYVVLFNPPTVDKLDILGSSVFTGVPVCPVVQLRFADSCDWQWHRRNSPSNNNNSNNNNSNSIDHQWEAIPGATEQVYVPTPEDVGSILEVVCTPTRMAPCDKDMSGTSMQSVIHGDPLKKELSSIVCEAPNPGPGAGRHEMMSAFTDAPQLRAVTYNILADQYASTESAKNQIFAHCPPEYLSADYRRPLVLGELLGYHADILCLQEVDEKMFSLMLQPALQHQGYEGIYTNKSGAVREGSATFWRSSRFDMKNQHSIVMKELFPPPQQSTATPKQEHYHSVFGDMLKSSPALAHALQKVGTIGQLTLLVDTEHQNTPLLVANTHLFFHARAPHIRTMHTYALMREAHTFLRSIEDLGSTPPALVFCGDMNSDLNDGIPGAIHLLQHGRLPADHWDWSYGVQFKWESEDSSLCDEVQKMEDTDLHHLHPCPPHSPEEAVTGVDLSLPWALAAADDLKSGFTNYVKGYQGLLDYIWYDPRYMSAENGAELPGVEALDGSYLPNKRFPSDHLAVVWNLRYKSDSGYSSDFENGSGSDSGEDDDDAQTAVLPAELYNVGIAAKALDAGKVIAVPTDTLYGLAAAASNSTAVERIYRIKGRSYMKPVAICIADVEDLGTYGDCSHIPRTLLEDLLPGPVTVVLNRLPHAPVATSLTTGIDNRTIAIRIPNSLFLRAVCRQHRGALALTSANLSGDASTVSISEFEQLWSSCKVIFNGGNLKAGREGSTVVDLTVPNSFKIVRKGMALQPTLDILKSKYMFIELH